MAEMVLMMAAEELHQEVEEVMEAMVKLLPAHTLEDLAVQVIRPQLAVHL